MPVGNKRILKDFYMLWGISSRLFIDIYKQQLS